MEFPLTLIDRLLASDEPAVRYKVAVQVLGQNPESSVARQLQLEVKASPRVRPLLGQRVEAGQIPHHPYTKWVGAHWVLSCQADIGYPAGAVSLIPLPEQVCRWLAGREEILPAALLLQTSRVYRVKSWQGLIHERYGKRISSRCPKPSELSMRKSLSGVILYQPIRPIALAISAGA